MYFEKKNSNGDIKNNINRGHSFKVAPLSSEITSSCSPFSLKMYEIFDCIDFLPKRSSKTGFHV